MGEKPNNNFGYCKNCKFWDRGSYTIFDINALQWDGKPHPNAGKTIFTPGAGYPVEGTGENGNCKAVNRKLFTAGGDGTYGELSTNESFGCVVFEEISNRSHQFSWRRYFGGSKFEEIHEGLPPNENA